MSQESLFSWASHLVPMSFWGLKSWVKVPSGQVDCRKLSAACFPPLLNIHSIAAKAPYPLSFRLCIYLLTVLNPFHHISNSVLKAFCCFLLTIFRFLSLSFPPCCALTCFPQAHSFFWSTSTVSPSCSYWDFFIFYPLNRILPPLSARTRAALLESSPTRQCPHVIFG